MFPNKRNTSSMNEMFSSSEKDFNQTLKQFGLNLGGPNVSVKKNFVNSPSAILFRMKHKDSSFTSPPKHVDNQRNIENRTDEMGFCNSAVGENNKDIKAYEDQNDYVQNSEPINISVTDASINNELVEDMDHVVYVESREDDGNKEGLTESSLHVRKQKYRSNETCNMINEEKTKSKVNIVNEENINSAKEFSNTPCRRNSTTEQSVKNGQKKSVREYVLKDWTIEAVPASGGIRVEGKRKEDPDGEFWHSTAIVNRIDRKSLETKSGTVYRLVGNISSYIDTNWPPEFKKLRKYFINGFPENWKKKVQEFYSSLLDLDRETVNIPVEKTCQVAISNTDVADAKKPRKSSTRTKVKNMKKGKVESKQNEGKQRSTKMLRRSIHDDEPVVEVKKMPRSRSGRIIKPVLAWWANQRVIVSPHCDAVTIESESTNVLKGTKCFKISNDKREVGKKLQSQNQMNLIQKQRRLKRQNSILSNSQDKISNTCIDETLPERKTLYFSTDATNSDSAIETTFESSKKSISKKDIGSEPISTKEKRKRRNSVKNDNKGGNRAVDTSKRRKGSMDSSKSGKTQDIEDSPLSEGEYAHKLSQTLAELSQRNSEQFNKSVDEMDIEKCNNTVSRNSQSKKDVTVAARQRKSRACTGTIENKVAEGVRRSRRLKGVIQKDVIQGMPGEEESSNESDDETYNPQHFRKQNKKHSGTGSVLISTKNNKNNNTSQEARFWTRAEEKELFRIVASLQIEDKDCWIHASNKLDGRTPEDCYNQYYKDIKDVDHVKKARSKQRQQKKNAEKITRPDQITAKKGTLERKLQMHELIQNQEDCDDDFFGSTPMRNQKGPKLNLEEIADDNGKLASMTPLIRNFKTPKHNLVCTPASPVKTPCHVSGLTPGITLDSIDWKKQAKCVHQVQQRDKQRSKGRKLLHSNQKSSTTMAKTKTTGPLPEIGRLFPCEGKEAIADSDEVIEDSDEEKDYYWSDNEENTK